LAIYTLNPLTDARWPDLLLRHPAASVFHTSGWLTALQRTYNYEPMVVTTCAPEAELTNGVVFCRVNSLLTGSRWVSLPFSDHCEPLAESEAELEQLLNSVVGLQRVSRCGYAEIRPLHSSFAAIPGFGAAGTFFIHELPLGKSPAGIFSGFNKDSIQRKIRRAEREGLGYEEGLSGKLIEEFYRLLLLTRRRHQLPPQPVAWFYQLAACLGDKMKIRVAYKNGEAIASIITLQFKASMVYKYGCSDAAYHNTGAMQMLFWKTIQEALASGLKTFDLGRCEIDNTGLAIFKERWGATRSLMAYWTTPPVSKAPRKMWDNTFSRRVFMYIPDWLLTMSGRLLYRHIG
jgi:CelD/BcsL family acetyltransferase involved in cellulose biosynthesis